MQFSGLYPRVKNSLLWAQFWITLLNFELSVWLWGVEFASRTLGCQSRVSEGLGIMLGWPGSQHKPCPETWALGGTAVRTGSWELRGDAKAHEGQRQLYCRLCRWPVMYPFLMGGGWFVWVLFRVFWDTKRCWLNCITFLDGCLSSMRPPLQDTVGAIKNFKI